MKVKILGASGAQCRGHDSTSVLVGGRTLIDAGIGAYNLPLSEMEQIGDVLLTHSHLDHTAMLCLIAESRAGAPDGPGLLVHSLSETADAVRKGFLNGAIWPDFEKIDIGGTPLMSFAPFEPFREIEAGGLRVTPFPVGHVVPTVGFCLHGDREKFVFIADICELPAESAEFLSGLKNIGRMTVEVSYPEGMEDLARASGHLTPLLLEDVLAKMPSGKEILYCHVKPRWRDDIDAQIKKRFGGRLQPLLAGMEFDI